MSAEFGLAMPVPPATDRAAARKWSVVGVQPGKEARAEWHLRLQGFETYTPRHKTVVRHARRTHLRLAPFFPGYMFVSLDMERSRWRSINGTIGVRSLLMQGERPAFCPAGLVEQMIAMTDADGLLDLSSSLRPGQRVRIVVGPMAEMLGTLEKMDRAGRVRVLVEIMNREIALTLPVSDLVAAA